MEELEGRKMEEEERRRNRRLKKMENMEREGVLKKKARWGREE